VCVVNLLCKYSFSLSFIVEEKHRVTVIIFIPFIEKKIIESVSLSISRVVHIYYYVTCNSQSHKLIKVLLSLSIYIYIFRLAVGA